MKMTVLRTSLKESLRPRNFPPWVCPKDGQTSVPIRPKSRCHKWYPSTHNTHTPPSPVRGQHSTNTEVCTSTEVQAVVSGNHGCTKSCLWITQNSPSCSLPDKLPVDFNPRTLSCLEQELLLALQFLLLQYSWQFGGKKRGKETLFWSTEMLQLVFWLITEHSRPLPELQSLLELQSLQHRKKKLSLLVLVGNS